MSIEQMAREYAYNVDHTEPRSHAETDFLAGAKAERELLLSTNAVRYEFDPKSRCEDGSFDCYDLLEGEPVGSGKVCLVELLPIAARLKQAESELSDMKQAFEYGRKSFNKANNDAVDLMEQLTTANAKISELEAKWKSELVKMKEKQYNYEASEADRLSGYESCLESCIEELQQLSGRGV